MGCTHNFVWNSYYLKHIYVTEATTCKYIYIYILNNIQRASGEQDGAPASVSAHVITTSIRW